jgi:hypothetical protein
VVEETHEVIHAGYSWLARAMATSTVNPVALEEVEVDHISKPVFSTPQWSPPCPYCRKVRVADGRGLCRECGAPEEARKAPDPMTVAAAVVAGYAWGSQEFPHFRSKIGQY